MSEQLDITEVAMTAAFMWQGAFTVWDRMQQSEAPGDQAQTTWVYEIVSHAKLVEERWMKHQRDTDGEGVCGVWYYEVCEPFGEALAEKMLENNRPLRPDEVAALLEEIAVPFFNQ